MEDVDPSKLAKLEAILYASGRPISLTTLCAHLRLESEKEISALIQNLSENYEEDGSAIEIRELPRNKAVLQLKAKYVRLARRFSMNPILTRGPLKTLSFVAYHQPILQKKVAEARGSHAYGHLKMLEEMGLITREKKGRKTTIRTTPDFADYLGLSKERSIMRRQLRRLFKKLKLKKLEKN
jgi:segregation and condensation protein B